MNEIWIWPGLFFGGYILFLFFLCRKSWLQSSRRLAYRITDIWAFIVGITPSLFLLSHVLNHPYFELITVLVLLGFGQLAGIFLALLDNNDSKRTALAGSFLNIVAGAIAGVGLAFIYVGSVFTLAFVLVLVCVLTFFTYGLILLPIILIIAVGFGRREKNREQR